MINYIRRNLDRCGVDRIDSHYFNIEQLYNMLCYSGYPDKTGKEDPVYFPFDKQAVRMAGENENKSYKRPAEILIDFLLFFNKNNESA